VFGFANQSARRGAGIAVALQLLIEIEGGDDQQLLQPVVQRSGDMFARVLLGQGQVRRHPAQLRRPILQFRRALLKRRRGALAIGESVTNAKARPPPGVAT